MLASIRHRRHRATLLLLALAFVLPRLMVPPGYMPGADPAGHWTLVFCDPALRAAIGSHVHSHGSRHAGGDTCPFGMTGGPALLPQVATASLCSEVHELTLVTTIAPATRTRSIAANGARAPPVS
jgi:hypothetical protein